MLFNSPEFLIFLPLVFFLYWFVFQKSLKVQNSLLLISSYVFYGWWDYRFLSLIFLSTVVDYFVGLKIYDNNDKKTKKSYLWISIIFNLGLLGFFKYFNFFIDSWIDLLLAFGYEQKSTWSLNVILPVGISFYTFQTLSYSLDIYYGKLKPTKDFISFASFVSFFPQLVAGPIERASNLLPQILNSRVFNYAQGVDGLKLILWGFFKKLVIADNCAWHVDEIFNDYSSYPGSVLLLGAFFFAFQIYGDFSGYSDIATGTAKLLGINLRKNFTFPYFSRSIAEFWRRWHISLSSWFKDYLYIPLGGSRGSLLMQIINTFLIFVISGFWHGANFTFIFWGGLNAVYVIPSIIFKKNRDYLDIVKINKSLLSLKEIFAIVRTFVLTMMAWIFFRSNSLSDGLYYISIIFSKSIFVKPDFPNKTAAVINLALITLFLMIEWSGRKDNHALESIGKDYNILIRWIFFSFIFFLIGLFKAQTGTQFLYFQF